ncbi:MAG: hypothetical protein AAF967_12340 [Pseudomonadota bacterium]
MATSPELTALDNRFIEIYEGARSHVIDYQKSRGLLILVDDEMQLHHAGKPVQVFDGMQPDAYTRLKTNGHMPMALLCLLGDVANGEPLPEPRLRALADYAELAKAAAADLEPKDELHAGLLDKPIQLFSHCVTFMDTVLGAGRLTPEELGQFAAGATEDINTALAGAARVQLNACHARVTEIRNELLSEEEWKSLWVLVLGNYMARQGELFLQYFSRVLHTPEQGDRRLVYFEGDNVDLALERLGTVMLDAHASQAVFSDRDRLHRDVLADETARYLDTLLAG